jgi:dephospho-CoA kinase
MKVIAIVGLAGSGKSEAALFFKNKNYPVIRFGDITDLELKERGLEINEKNERYIREQLRKELGMDAYAKKNMPRILEALKKSDVVVLDGLYSWEEYLYLKEQFKDNLVVLALYAPPNLRYERLKNREVRPLTCEESANRDKAEIENINKAGPITMADFTIDNSGTLEELNMKLDKFLKYIEME